MLQFERLPETQPRRLTSALERAGSWFLQSGIQETNGGTARYYRSDSGENARVSTEITGYACGALIYLYDKAGDRAYRDAAVRGARFLAEKAWDAKLSLFPFEVPAKGEPPCQLAYFFDSGIIARGLLQLWRATGDRRFLDAAIAAGHSMISAFVHGGEIHPIVRLPEKRPLPFKPRWSASPGCYQLKAALAWRELHEETGEEVFLDAWEDCLDRSLRSQESFLPGAADRERVMDRLHAYCYFLEGLLPCLDRQPCARALAAGIDRVSHFIRQIAPVFERSDVFAQLLRLRVLAADAEVIALQRPAAEHEAATLGSFQIHSTDPRLNGGFYFGRKVPGFLPHISPVSTGFAMQALELWRERGDGQPSFDWRGLV